jgi:hypothetical protein
MDNKTRCQSKDPSSLVQGPSDLTLNPKHKALPFTFKTLNFKNHLKWNIVELTWVTLSLFNESHY